MANQYTNPKTAHFRYLGNQRWLRENRYTTAARWAILSCPNDYRRRLYAFFDQCCGEIRKTEDFGKIPDCMIGEVVTSPREFWHNFNEDTAC
jgi:hypothetical protein